MLSYQSNCCRALWPFCFPFSSTETRHKRQKLKTLSTATSFILPRVQHLFCAKMSGDGPWQQEKPTFGSLGCHFRSRMCHEAFIHEANHQGNVKTSGNGE